MKVLGVIPARGGSKGIPRKNLADVCGRPLIAWTIEQALAAESLDSVVLSTDDPEIADVGRRLGVEVPFLRPDELAQDSTPTIDVLVHLCQALQKDAKVYDAICLLQPTSPQRPGNLIDQCIERFSRSDADSLITVVRVPHQHNPHWVYWMNEGQSMELSTGGVEPIPRRQLLPDAFIRDGRVYLTKTQVIMQRRSLYGDHVVGFEAEPGINIDTMQDLESFRRVAESGQNSSR
ncbi:acylneuraminate cytidylyltransferase family protein [Stieleria varia]|uniref:CMP-N,N'-diacetyllegionaminic acid synthase n=1 Tax=Stieleria varia TaxID=2528005 RepID=A0A5C6AGV5_9BACT|nr:acylneuraminate cytidylyltransferase family protein [Stieleria varia]TWT98636.1 CMP-N,N'-diacetyllegionaminic acid synthase [Stieleria varia]